MVGHHRELVGGREHEHALLVTRLDRLEVGRCWRRLRLDRLTSRQALIHLARVDLAVRGLVVGEQHHDLHGAQIGARNGRTDAGGGVGDDGNSAHRAKLFARSGTRSAHVPGV